MGITPCVQNIAFPIQNVPWEALLTFAFKLKHKNGGTISVLTRRDIRSGGKLKLHMGQHGWSQPFFFLVKMGYKGGEFATNPPSLIHSS